MVLFIFHQSIEVRTITTSLLSWKVMGGVIGVKAKDIAVHFENV